MTVQVIREESSQYAFVKITSTCSQLMYTQAL